MGRQVGVFASTRTGTSRRPTHTPVGGADRPHPVRLLARVHPHEGVHPVGVDRQRRSRHPAEERGVGDRCLRLSGLLLVPPRTRERCEERDGGRLHGGLRAGADGVRQVRRHERHLARRAEGLDVQGRSRRSRRVAAGSRKLQRRRGRRVQPVAAREGAGGQSFETIFGPAHDKAVQLAKRSSWRSTVFEQPCSYTDGDPNAKAAWFTAAGKRSRPGTTSSRSPTRTVTLRSTNS